MSWKRRAAELPDTDRPTTTTSYPVGVASRSGRRPYRNGSGPPTRGSSGRLGGVRRPRVPSFTAFVSPVGTGEPGPIPRPSSLLYGLTSRRASVSFGRGPRPRRTARRRPRRRGRRRTRSVTARGPRERPGVSGGTKRTHGGPAVDPSGSAAPMPVTCPSGPTSFGTSTPPSASGGRRDVCVSGDSSSTRRGSGGSPRGRLRAGGGGNSPTTGAGCVRRGSRVPTGPRSRSSTLLSPSGPTGGPSDTGAASSRPSPYHGGVCLGSGGATATGLTGGSRPPADRPVQRRRTADSRTLFPDHPVPGGAPEQDQAGATLRVRAGSVTGYRDHFLGEG